MKTKKISLRNIDWSLTLETERIGFDDLFELHDFISDASVYISHEDVPAIERALKAIKQHYKED